MDETHNFWLNFVKKIDGSSTSEKKKYVSCE